MVQLENYDVSATHGFLPSEPPLRRLPEYYHPWEDICSDLHILNLKCQLADRVAQLPQLDTRYLVIEPQWRRAHVLLGFITNAYIWGPKTPFAVRSLLQLAEEADT